MQGWHTRIMLLCQPRGPRGKEHTGPQILVPKSIRSPVKEPGSLDKWPIAGLGQGTPKMGLEHLLAPESREVLRNNNTNLHKDGVCQSSTGAK